MSLLYSRNCQSSATASRHHSLMQPAGKELARTGLGLAATALLWLSHSVAIAQTPSSVGAIPEAPQLDLLMAQAPSPSTVLYVNPTSGKDSAGSGAESAPFKTVTQALSAAAPNTVILLAPGTYSAQTGETFPLMLKPGVTVQGDPRSRGQNITIIGGGAFLSPSVATQNITILAADKAGLTGVTVTNPNPRGYALWVESSSPLVADNTFTGSTHDGISVVGTSAPVIRGNYFKQNGANGITIYGSSQPQVQDNVFENTGFGVNIGQNAAPVLTGNRIIRNRSGVLVQANARPVLRNNQIEGNVQDGLVALAQAQPDLGNGGERGENVFRNNGQLDINAKASNQVIPAFGNQLSSDRTSGRIDVAGKVALAPRPVLPQPNRAASLSARTNPQPAATTPQPAATPAQPSVARNSRPVRPAPTGAPVAASSSRPYKPVSASQAAIDIPVPPPSSASASRVPPSESRSTLPILAPPPPGTQAAAPVVLPVPGPDIPLGDGAPPASAAGGGSAALRYRVIVETSGEREQARVRALVPEAFRTFLNGRVVMQAGVFSSRDNADEMMEKLKRQGFKATMDELE
ncbi:DUF1565 domain-containing protein [Microcoleus sp. FACHB-672]|uniref:DUF1565 domain-containing protein n=1 Tax=Microcoleus sp. FACHB-672 TaxID=2692825 RepID=UPI0018EFE821|nr:DUF1565 domain-containing protein [Microcoleus sp. FACHB-672]